jgi:hypothetical protein
VLMYQSEGLGCHLQVGTKVEAVARADCAS